MLYVAITRPRHRLIIFDTDKGKRQPVFDLMLHKKVVQSSWDLKESFFKAGTTKEWRERGLMMYRQELFDDALVCFENSGDELLASKTRAKVEMVHGEKKEREGRWVEASERFRDAAAAYAELMAEGTGHEGQWREAVERVARCLEQGSKYGEAAVEFERVDLWTVSGRAF